MNKPDGDYFIRKFPAELKKAAQHRAVEEGTNLKQVILAALREYLEKHSQ